MYVLLYIVEAAEIMRSICLAINHLHNMNIVHRDIKVSKPFIGVHTCVTDILLNMQSL